MNRFIAPVKERLRELEERSYVFSVMASVYRRMGDHEVSQSAGSVAFSAFLSIFPLVLALLGIFSPFLDSDRAQETLRDFFNQYLPESLGLLEQNLESVQNWGGVLGLVGVLLLAWSASSVFGAMTSAFNRAWEVGDERSFFVTKGIQLAMVFGAGTMLCLSIGSTVLSEIVGGLLELDGSAGEELVGFMLSLAFRIASVAATFTAVLVLFTYLPSVSAPIDSLWKSALVTAVIFDIFKNLFIWYLANFADYGAVYGSLAAVIALLVWLQLSAQIVISGVELCAELTARSRKPS